MPDGDADAVDRAGAGRRRKEEKEDRAIGYKTTIKSPRQNNTKKSKGETTDKARKGKIISDLTLDLKSIKELLDNPEFAEYKSQLTAIKRCLLCLKEGRVKMDKNLPNTYKDAIQELMKLEKMIDSVSDPGERNELRKMFSKDLS